MEDEDKGKEEKDKDKEKVVLVEMDKEKVALVDMDKEKVVLVDKDKEKDKQEDKVQILNEGEGNVLSNVPPPTELPLSFAQTVTLMAGLGPPKKIDLALDIATDFNQVPEAAEETPQEEESPPPPKSVMEYPWPTPPDQKEEAIVEPEVSTVIIPNPPDNDGFGNVMPGTALLSWVKGAVATGGILHKVAEKAKSSVDTMITTLDPQMKEYMRSGGDTFVVVASDKEVKIAPVREAFQTVFGKAVVVGYPAQSEVTAVQPVGYAAAYAAAKQRIAHVRSTHAELPDNAPVVAIEAFLHQALPDKWYDISLLVLSQPTLGIELHVQSQGTPVAGAAVGALRERTPTEYAHAQTGFSHTIGALMAEYLKVPHTQWQEACTGVSRFELLTLAAKSLATQYKRQLNSMSSNET